MHKHTFSIRKSADDAPQTFVIDAPDDINDPWWDSHTTSSDDRNTLAFGKWLIQAQAAWRNSGTHPSDFVYGQRGGARVRVVVVERNVLDASTFFWPESDELAMEQYNSIMRSNMVLVNDEAIRERLGLPLESDD